MADSPVLELLLRRLEAADGGLDSAELATQLGVEHQVVVGAVKSLQALGEVSSARPPARLAFTPVALRAGEGRLHRGAPWGKSATSACEGESVAHVGCD